jgi:hypothetical protein
MKSIFPWIAVWAAVILWPSAGMAADVSRLEWGDFVVETDSSNGYQEISSTSSDDGLTLSLTFSALEAKADGGTTEASANAGGHFNVAQPKFDTFAMARVTLEGHVIKSTSAMARLVLKVAGTEQSIEWPEGTVASEKFARTLDIAMPADGRIPQPFAVSIAATAKKIGYADAAYVSVSGVKIVAVPDPKVAAN